jgi:hypothetical protein
MIKMLAKDDGVTILHFGLSRANINRLIAGDPILIRAEDMDPDLKGVKIGIFFGETEAEMQAMLRREGLIGPETKVTVDPRLKT